MIVGRGRFKIPRAGFPGGGSSSEGLVVQAVLLMALVSTIGVLIFAVRVAGSRQASASASMSQAARQAAEYGYAEILAEMNRNPKSYLWVLNSSNWNNVSTQDLKTCGVASSADPSNNPIPALTSNQSLSRSAELSYRLTNYEAPRNLYTPSSGPDVCKTKFGNLLGGTGIITIVGTANRDSGDTSTYTLKRTVSVNRAAPIFNNPITSIPANRTIDAADSRFPPFPDAPTTIPSYALTCQPQVDTANVASTSIIECTAVPSNGDPPLTQNFKSATATNSTAPGLDDFPFVVGQALPWWTPCSKVEVIPGDERVRCLFTSIRVRANSAASTVKAKMRVKTDTFPVEFFLINDMTIEPGSTLSGLPDYEIVAGEGDGKGWSRFRIFGVNSGTSCGSQAITFDSFNNPDTLKVEPNLQNAFLWLSQGKLKYQSSTVVTRIPALVGYVCEFETGDGRLLPASTAAAPAYSSTLGNRGFLEGLGGAYGGLGEPPLFRGVFGGAAPIRFFYRGIGFNEQRLSS